MTTIPVDAESPSVTTQPSILTTVSGVLVAWHPERGFQCQEHQVVPCAHTDAVIPGKHPLWRQ